MNIYRLKISLAEPFLPLTELHRLVDMDTTMSFGELATHIGSVFGTIMADWRFFISRIKTDNLAKLQAFDSIHADNDTAFNTLDLNEKDYFYLKSDGYLYRIRIEKSSDNDANERFILIKSVGELPNITSDTPNPNVSPELDFELTLISAMMLVVGDPQNPISFGELAESGVADELVARGLIKPCVHPSQKVRATALGKDELMRVMKKLGI
ncbi:MAG: hypothetical protein Q4B79_01285 [Moraxella sp.]|uniref:hypothetical protein n=1 Tax=Moraxella sp. TaxID=479 RepID=UPI0026DC6E4E|nr:hypothetical protein [Moraxella sp.]MDO4449579.1 hypothetical protein [Moraxella sp.]